MEVTESIRFQDLALFCHPSHRVVCFGGAPAAVCCRDGISNTEEEKVDPRGSGGNKLCYSTGKLLKAPVPFC